MARRPRPSGIADVAARAGVSVTTVSHSLSGRRPVAEATRQRVAEAIAELGYQPNELARSMRSQRTNTVALIVPDITNPFYTSVARGLLDVLTPASYVGIVCNTDADPELEQKIVQQMITRRVDGIAFSGYYEHHDDVAPAVAAGIPTVMLGHHSPAPGVDVVNSDDHASGADATRYLLGKGHRKIGFITAPAGSGAPAERVRGYQTALSEFGVPLNNNLVVRAPVGRDGGAEGMRALLDQDEPPTAVICTNDIVAIGALDTARERGLQVPDDVAVMGFDDIEAARLITPQLTTMAYAPREIGQAVATILLNRIDGAPATHHRRRGARLMVRESA
ncbi:LacI family DNA-binding transcriptional regulator [Phytoactinopolyspora limicola]|uniref:LacI family DNA-binding transcriptional regulator n=1 Tax=Phytoactinopolyspora limicola TaxID=2715536 RepID=UPI00140D2486|nr:LacI family DNA-binding transcriptional regulator [Phytoactinopolyspora limicola]